MHGSIRGADGVCAAQMVQFIHQEAKEKASEIKLKTDEEFNIEKLRMVEAEKQKIRAAYEVKEKQVEVQKRIAQSNEVRFSRLKALKARDDAMLSVLKEAGAALPAVVSSPEYPALLEKLILEVRARRRARHGTGATAGVGVASCPPPRHARPSPCVPCPMGAAPRSLTRVGLSARPHRRSFSWLTKRWWSRLWRSRTNRR